MHYIYVIQNKTNLKLYVGQSINPKKRWHRHKSAANKNGQYPINRAIRKYGADLFTFQIIEEYSSQKDTDEAECFWIEYFQALNPEFGYNLRPGGNTSTFTAETRKKMSDAQMGKTRPDRIKWPADEVLISTIKERGMMKASGLFKIDTTTIYRRIKKKGLDPIFTQHRVCWPANEELLTMIEQNGLSATAKILNVHISAISKRLERRKLRIPIPKKCINWPNDTELVSSIQALGYDEVSKQLNASTITLINRVRKRSLTKFLPQYISLQGENCGNSKLKSDQVLEIVKLHNTDNYSHRDLGKLFNIDKSIIGDIVNGKIWRSITKLKPKTNLQGNYKLNKQQVLEIIKLRNEGYMLKELAAKFNITINAIGSITNGYTWSHITGIIPNKRKQSQ